MKVFKSWDAAYKALLIGEIAYGEYVANPDIQRTLGEDTWLVWQRINEKEDEVLHIGVFWSKEEAIQHGEAQTLNARWEKLKDLLAKEHAFEAELFDKNQLTYKRLCEGEIQDIGDGPIQMVWLHLNALHQAIQSLMAKLEDGVDIEFEAMKMMVEYKRMLEETTDGLGQGA